MPAARSAYAKNLDPTLIAAVIYAESRFRDDQTSPAGAEGLMQVTPATARMIARKSGGIAFVVEDLGTPQVNIAYGAWYLRYLLARYGGKRGLRPSRLQRRRGATSTAGSRPRASAARR